MSDRYAVKLTVKFNDGSAEDFDIFLAVVATGLIPVGKEDCAILYTASGKFAAQSIAHVTATPEVAVGLVLAVESLVQNMIDSLPPEIAPKFLEALLLLNSKETELYHVAKSIKLRRG